MDITFSTRPVGVPAATPIVQPASEAANNAVRTELPPQQTVTASDAGGAVRHDTQTPANATSKQVIVDRAAGSIVYQVIDESSDQVVDQFPEEATLRRRAYINALDTAKAEQPKPYVLTDLSA